MEGLVINDGLLLLLPEAGGLQSDVHTAIYGRGQSLLDNKLMHKSRPGQPLLRVGTSHVNPILYIE